jgi:6-phosphogluconate dehydrogenase (decarboxylating)
VCIAFRCTINNQGANTNNNKKKKRRRRKKKETSGFRTRAIDRGCSTIPFGTWGKKQKAPLMVGGIEPTIHVLRNCKETALQGQTDRRAEAEEIPLGHEVQIKMQEIFVVGHLSMGRSMCAAGQRGLFV